MHLYDLWFIAIAVLWIGYFLLEGFDFGVGILVKGLARTELERRVLINTIGPVRDGNEVWLLTAGGATFVAFPDWSASLFSGFSLPLLLILMALIVRGVALECRGKRDSLVWRRRWDLAIFWGSLVPALLWGVAFANILRGVPLDSRHSYVGSLWDLLGPYALLGGLSTLGLFIVHGALFLGLKTTGDLRDRAVRLAQCIGPVVAGFAVLFLGLSAQYAARYSTPMILLLIVASLSFVAALGLGGAGRDGWAFALSGAAIAIAVAGLFTGLYPNVLPSTLNTDYSLTAAQAAAAPKTLGIITGVAVVVLPLVLAYQAWTVFRRRLGARDIPAPT